MKRWEIVCYGILAALLVGIIFYFSPEIKRHIGIRMAEADRDIFEHGGSYVRGKIQNLTRLRAEYLQSQDPRQREALAEIIRMEAADVREKLPNDLYLFLKEL